jgi:predicted metal-dependent peptidase
VTAARPLVGLGPFLDHHPQFAHLLARLEIVADAGVDVMAVSAHGVGFRLHVNVAFFERHPEFLIGVLLHEVHHLILGHVTDRRFRVAEHPDLMQLAMEASANEHVMHPLPGRPVRWQELACFGLGPRQSTLERYERLVRARREGLLPEGLVARCLDVHLARSLERLGPEHERLVGRVLRRVLRRAMVQQCAPGIGAGELIERLTGPPLGACLDWRTALRAFVPRRRVPDVSFMRPNRRFPKAVGRIPGRVRRQHAGRARLLVAIDTSASMSRPELVRIRDELTALSVRADFTIVECDAKIQRVYRFEGALASLRGRGGTDLRPVFQPEFLRAHDPDGVVYFTDGEGPWPRRPPHVPTLWVLTKPDGFACPWGLRASLAPARFALRSGA